MVFDLLAYARLTQECCRISNQKIIRFAKYVLQQKSVKTKFHFTKENLIDCIKLILIWIFLW